MPRLVYLNGEIVEADAAFVSAFDAGLLHGAGLFETMRAYGGVIFRQADHLARLNASAEALSMFSLDAASKQAVADGMSELLRRSELADARVRLTVTTGDVLRAEQDDAGPEPTVLATATHQDPLPAETYESGITALISKHKQSRLDPTCGFKTLNYLSRLISLREAQAIGCAEAIWFTHENLLAEGAISNVFIVADGVVKTPSIDTPVLPGVTRKVVIELAEANGISIQETPLTINDLLDAAEVFMTNSVREIVPVCRVERRAIGDEKPGPITRQLIGLYRRTVAEECHLDVE